LADVIRALRGELDRAMSEGEGERVQFEAQSIELEFQVGVTKSTEGSGAVRFWVLELGGGASYGSESIQRVSLSLQPVLSDGGNVKIAKGGDQGPGGM
jgi:hypothetical protein